MSVLVLTLHLEFYMNGIMVVMSSPFMVDMKDIVSGALQKNIKTILQKIKIKCG